MAIQIGRREFIVTLGGAATTWSLSAHAQQRKAMRRIGVNLPVNDQPAQARYAALKRCDS
jgi:hypothetical protein